MISMNFGSANGFQACVLLPMQIVMYQNTHATMSQHCYCFFFFIYKAKHTAQLVQIFKQKQKDSY